MKAVAALLAARLRSVDLAARLGGEEFAVLLPGNGQQAGAATAERLRAAIAEHRIRYAETTLALSASIGVVACPQHGRTSEILIRMADDALYSAKRANRDRICAPPPSGPP